MSRTKVVALAGGSGSAKLLRGLAASGVDLTVVSNVGDNFWFHGLYVCPDVDIATYALAGVLDATRGWGIRGDTFEVLGQIEKLGGEAWFRLGDKDMATCLLRTKMSNEGVRLTDATDSIRKRFNVLQKVLPATDDPLVTRVETPAGFMHLQEFWVKERGVPEVLRVEYQGEEDATVTPEVLTAIMEAERVVLCPANPVSSIGPIVSVGGVADALAKTEAKVVAVSPMEGSAPFSGPAAKFMRASGMRTDCVGVADSYAKFLDAMLISSSDEGLSHEIRSVGVEPRPSDIRMSGGDGELRVAKEVLSL